MPVAKSVSFEIENFVKVARSLHGDDIERLYVLARGNNVQLAKLTLHEIEKSKTYKKVGDWEYSIVGRKKGKLPSYVAEMQKM